ncbi:hypothetical protein GCM10010430_29490 [Kitasatospora cystarginea]|uniref:Uncharacterized protein n=1 Tax=Kitasatospora cystarginea TaxID=58350 RepID=A0ABP5QVU7_9ACTN
MLPTGFPSERSVRAVRPGIPTGAPTNYADRVRRPSAIRTSALGLGVPGALRLTWPLQTDTRELGPSRLRVR